MLPAFGQGFCLYTHTYRSLPQERRRHLQALLESGHREAPSRQPRSASSRKNGVARPSLRVVPGHTVLVVDTNILLSSLVEFSALVESKRWTVVVPLPVIMELDSQSSNASQLGEAASAARQYIASHIHSHSMSFEALTSRGNYLTNLNV